MHACDPFLLYNHEQWAVYSYNLSIGRQGGRPAAAGSSGRGEVEDVDEPGTKQWRALPGRCFPLTP
jgi:hypothetical protein